MPTPTQQFLRILCPAWAPILLLASPSTAAAFTVLGTGSSALLGGDLTDPEDDGDDSTAAGSGFNWVSTAASEKNHFSDEGALDVFDGQVGGGDAKWCCSGPPQWVAVQFAQPYTITHFTVAAGNDEEGRDPKEWFIEGSNDGSAWTTIYHWNSGGSPFPERSAVVRFDGGGNDFATPAAYTWFRYRVAASVGGGHQLSELEFFGTSPGAINSFTASPSTIAPGDPVALSWDVEPGVSALSIDQLVGDVFPDTTLGIGSKSLEPGPATTTTYTLTADGTEQATATVTVLSGSPGVPEISEFMASNDGAAIVDEDSASSDWIEIHNPSATPALLGGYFLTDDPTDLQKWAFPPTSLSTGGYLVVFASGKNRTTADSELHTNFSLRASGEYLALIKPDGTTIVSEFGPAGVDYPDQDAGISFGFFGSPAQQGYFDTATPGAANSGGFFGYVKDTTFSVKRGFYDTSQSLTIASATPSAIIRYTTDGSTPSETAGTIYTAPITVDRTMPVRAIAYKTGHRPTNVDTQTYIFVDDVVTQSAANTQSIWGLPATWDGESPDYGMQQSVAAAPPHNATIKNDLKTVPSLSIVMPTDDLFGASGVYSNPDQHGSSWERATSFELIDPASVNGSNDFQIDAGIRIHGGAFRSFSLSKKKSFRLLFKGSYGDSKLRYPLFGPGAAQEFDTLVLRMDSNDGFQWTDSVENVQYARDQFARQTALDLGIPAPHGRYFHLYLNGVYWGIYNAVERPDVSFGAAYFGADKDEWDSINTGSATNDSSADYWKTLLDLADDVPAAADEPGRTAAYMKTQGLNPDGSDNPAWANFINVDNYIDYLLVNWYLGNHDWPQFNYYTGRERDLLDPAPLTGSRTSSGTHFFMWDSELTMFLSSDPDRTDQTTGVAEPYGYLRDSLEFRVRFGDRAQRAMFNDGALTAAPSVARYSAVTADHPSILVPELARWGDQHLSATETYVHNLAAWQTAADRIRNEWITPRAPEMVTLLRAVDLNLYPSIDAPFFSQHGGSVSPATAITIASGADTLHYTTDGSDPREIGGAVASGATSISFGSPGNNVSPSFHLTSPTTLRARAKNSATAEWSALTEAFFSIDSVPADDTNLVISEFSYRPAQPAAPGETAITTDRDDYEFIELLNIGPGTVDLTGVSFTDGILFEFQNNTLLEPGERILVVKHLAAFEARHGTSHNIAGTFSSGRLSNDGERVLLTSSVTGDVREFTYNDQPPWPTAADGDGFSLVLIAPQTNPTHSVAANWRSSAAAGGEPGGTDSVTFADWKLARGITDETADPDGDTLNNFGEFAGGTAHDSESSASLPELHLITVGSDDYLAIDVRRSQRAVDDAELVVMTSPDLGNWTADAIYVGEVNNGDGATATVTYRCPTPYTAGSRQFIKATFVSR